jgi:hypothetical protein
MKVRMKRFQYPFMVLLSLDAARAAAALRRVDQRAYYTTQMKLLPLICTIWLIAYCCPSWAGDRRFLELPAFGRATTTFDLGTVQIIQPGRFTIIETTIDDPDVMKFKLKVLDTLRSYCARPEGKYPVPPDVFTLGPPDMPVKNIEVKHNHLKLKLVYWSYPYKVLAAFSPGFLGISCVGSEYGVFRAQITNGIRTKHLYDCKRGLEGFVLDENDTTKAVTGFVRKGTYAFEYYLSVCRAVTHEDPYVPK